MVIDTGPFFQGRRRRKHGLRGAIYARYSTRFQHSIDDQVREDREWADRNGIEVVRVFTDKAEKGRSTRRKGLKALQQALENDEIDVVIVFTTNRLYRKMYQSLMFVEEEIVDRGKRCVFVRSGIDTADSDDWRQRLQLHALIDEFLVQTIAKHVHAAHEGLLLQIRVFGTLTFGYTGEEIPGVTTRLGRPARRLIIDPETKKWVKKIFRWFTQFELSLAEIIRRLNAKGAPLPPRSTTKRWTRLAVRGVLTNARYIGCWAYGSTKAVWLNKKSYSRQVPRDAPLREITIEDLRIIDDVTWAKAQERLHNLQQNAGRHPKDGDRKSRPRVLNNLIYCEKHHEKALHVGNAYGKYMFCSVCRDSAERFLFSQLPRKLALELICDRLAALIREDEDLIQKCITAAQETVEEFERPDPSRLADLNRQLVRLNGNIQFILDAPGETDEDQDENHKRLTALRRERATVQREIAEQEELAQRPLDIPNPDEIREQLDQFAEILQRAAESDDPEELAAARQIIRLITGGRIIASQCGERKQKRGWVRLRFSVNLLRLISIPNDVSSNGELEVEIDVLPPDTTEHESERVKKLYDAGLEIREIANQTGWHRNRVTKLLKYWFESRGLEMPNNRARRHQLPKKQEDLPVYQQIADEVHSLWFDGLSDSEMGRRFGCSDTTVQKAFVWWHTSRNLPVPNKESRRQALRERVKRLSDRRVPLKKIAKDVGVSDVTVRKLLKEWYADQGLSMPDGRTTRHQPPKPGDNTSTMA